ncbi:hypothetical protein LXT12_26335 [Pelomonas sp. P7]|uniref:Uncharacterized protein n=1 Tax=Pelomonas caseinilytica TaxID=2906763 RepID=A0ABS8XIR6_9BURK|nr:hypothetical protein [Pelomonas sp. P7]MCE4540752.1 hypothetical protein [Pelomonas sp. P7]
MKRIRIAPGKFVTISNELAEKAARVFATGLTRDQVLALSATEPRHTAGLMAGSPKPLAAAKPRGAAKPKPLRRKAG